MTTQRMALPLASRAAGIGVSGLLLYLVCLGYQRIILPGFAALCRRICTGVRRRFRFFYGLENTWFWRCCVMVIVFLPVVGSVALSLQ